MTRRDVFAISGAALAAGAVRLNAQQSALQDEIVRLQLKHKWTTVMSTSTYRDTLFLQYGRDGIVGQGEGAPIVRYNETPQSAKYAVEAVRGVLEESDPAHFEKILAEAFKRIEGQNAAKSAIDIALMDWTGQKLGIPLYRYFGLDPADAPITTFSIGIDDPATTKAKVEEAAEYPVLKIKVGLDSDEATIAAVRAVTKKPLRVDANEGWKTKEEAVRKINWLETQGVEWVEQPLAADRIEDTRWIRGRVHIPLIADESCVHEQDIPKLKDAFDGVNVKLDKAGGMLSAYRMIQLAKSLGMKTMLGCMVSSSCTVTAAAHLSPLVDWADLDGNLLISNDPFEGVTVKEGKLILPNRPGLGLRKHTAF